MVLSNFLISASETANSLGGLKLKPAFGKSEFFYSREFRRMLKIEEDSMGIYSEELENTFRNCSGKW